MSSYVALLGLVVATIVKYFNQKVKSATYTQMARKTAQIDLAQALRDALSETPDLRSAHGFFDRHPHL